MIIISHRLLSENQNGTHQNPESSSKAHTDADDKEKEFWEKPCPFTPESRLEAHRHLEDKRRATEKERYLPTKKKRTEITVMVSISKYPCDAHFSIFTFLWDKGEKDIKLLHVFFCKQLYLLQSILCFYREKPKNKTLRTLINADGRVLNINEPKYTHKNTHTHTTPV